MIELRRNYQHQTWDQGIDTGVDPDTGEVCEARASQEQKDECDINVILKRFEKTGVLPEMIKSQPHYGDFSSVPDFQAAQNIVAHANEQFAALDAHIRKRFGNDPAEFLAFASDPSNQDEMIRLGLATRKPQEAPGDVKKEEAVPPAGKNLKKGPAAPSPKDDAAN